jgi:hypothetical protein
MSTVRFDVKGDENMSGGSDGVNDPITAAFPFMMSLLLILTL